MMNRAFLLLPLSLTVLGAGADTAQPRGNPFSTCLAVSSEGLFNDQTLACFPWLRQAVETKLCETSVGRYGDFSRLGFGAGFKVSAVPLLGQQAFIEMSAAAQAQHTADFWASFAAWRAEKCAGDPAAASTPEELLEPWEEIYRRLPLSLVAPWCNCWAYLLTPTDPGFQAGGARCFAESIPDPRGKGETILLSVRVGPTSWFDARTRLREDLEIRGLDCGDKAWRKGKGLKNTELNVLECRRLGRSAVYFKAVTAKGTCEAQLPGLAQSDWRDRCQGQE